MVQIELKNLDKIYKTGKLEFRALKKVDLVIKAGELTAIVGPSGSGKSTILNMITGIDRPTNGTVVIDGKRIDNMKVRAGRSLYPLSRSWQRCSSLLAFLEAAQKRNKRTIRRVCS